MKIRMLQTVPGSTDGIRVNEYESGVEYDLSDTSGEIELAEAFIAAGFAEQANKQAPAPQNKAAQKPANK